MPWITSSCYNPLCYVMLCYMGIYIAHKYSRVSWHARWSWPSRLINYAGWLKRKVLRCFLKSLRSCSSRNSKGREFQAVAVLTDWDWPPSRILRNRGTVIRLWLADRRDLLGGIKRKPLPQIRWAKTMQGYVRQSKGFKLHSVDHREPM